MTEAVQNKAVDDMSSMLTPQAAAKLLGVSERHLNNLRHRGDGPRSVKIGKCRRYPLDYLEQYVEGKARQEIH